METRPVLVLAISAALMIFLLVTLLVVVAFVRRTRRALDDSRAEVAALHARLETLSGEIEAARVAGKSSLVAEADYVSGGGASSLHEVHAGARSPGGTVANGVVLSATIGEPLVKALAFGYGVRRALAPAARNRIAFEMRRETKRVRKQRRRELRRARRDIASQAAA